MKIGVLTAALLIMLGFVSNKKVSPIKNSTATITNIDYLPVEKGYAALVSYKLNNGQTGSYGIISAENIYRLRPIPIIDTVETPGIDTTKTPKKSSGKVMLVCTGTCQCKAYMAYNKSTGIITFSCGCDQCSAKIVQE